MTLAPRANRAVVTDVYEDLAPLVRSVADQFSGKYKRDRDETRAEANLHFLEAYHNYNFEHGTTLEQRVVFIVWTRLKDTMLTERERDEVPMPVWQDEGKKEELDPAAPPEAAPFDVKGFSARVDLSHDAERIIRKLLNGDGPLEESLLKILSRRRHRSDRSDRAMACLRRYLIGNLGWGAARVAETFAELKRVFS